MKAAVKWDKMTAMKDVWEQFHIEGRPVFCRPYGQGHIHASFRLETDGGKSYLLQKINRAVFSDVDGLMKNIAAVTEHLRRKGRRSLTIVPARDRRLYYEDAAGQAWRMYEFVDGLCLQNTQDPAQLWESARAFGDFIHRLSDLPAQELALTIPNFHHTPRRYEAFREALAADPLGRRASAGAEAEFLLAREARGGELQRRLEVGGLPCRICHNDTKLNNILLDKDSGKALCVLDLDTVMPGLAAWDFGDGVRSAAAVDGADGQTQLCLALYEAYLRGFLTGCPSLTVAERQSLPLGAWTMTLELALRYLTDYLLGAPYFGESDPVQNLQKARRQLSLLADMEKKQEAMERLLRTAEKEPVWF